MEDFFPPVVLSRGFKHILSFLLRLLYFERPFPRYLLQFLLSSQFLAYVSPFCKRFSSVTQEEEPSCALPWCFASTVIQCSLGGGIVVHFVFQLDCELCECWDCVSSVSLASLASGSSLLLNKAQISPNWLKGRLINFQTSYWLFKLLSFWVTGVWIPREEINRWWYVLVDWVPLRKKERDIWFEVAGDNFWEGQALGWALTDVQPWSWQGEQGPRGERTAWAEDIGGVSYEGTLPTLTPEPLSFLLHPLGHLITYRISWKPEFSLSSARKLYGPAKAFAILWFEFKVSS